MLTALAYTSIFAINSMLNHLAMLAGRWRGLIVVVSSLISFLGIYALGISEGDVLVSVMVLVTATSYILCQRKIDNSFLVIPLLIIFNSPIAILIILYVGLNISSSASKTVLNLLLAAVTLTLVSNLHGDLTIFKFGALLLLIATLVRVYYEEIQLGRHEVLSTFALLSLSIAIAKLFILFSLTKYMPIIIIVYALPLLNKRLLSKTTYVEVARVICISSVLMGFLSFWIGLSIIIFVEAMDIIVSYRLPAGELRESSMAIRLNFFLIFSLIFLTAYALKANPIVMASFVVIALLFAKQVATYMVRIRYFHVLSFLQILIVLFVGCIQWL